MIKYRLALFIERWKQNSSNLICTEAVCQTSIDNSNVSYTKDLNSQPSSWNRAKSYNFLSSQNFDSILVKKYVILKKIHIYPLPMHSDCRR